MAIPPGSDWDAAPCALVQLRSDGLLLETNQLFLDWLGRERDELVGKQRLSQLLSVGGRIFWETHLAPLLHVEGRLDEVALELVAAAGRVPVLLTAVVRPASDGAGGIVHVAMTSAAERSRYERELLAARRTADSAAAALQLLQRVTAALSEALGVAAVADAVLSAAVLPLGAAAGALWLVGEGDGLVRHGAVGQPAPATPPPPRMLRDGVVTDADGHLLVPLLGSVDLHGVLVLRPQDGLAAEALDVGMLTTIGQQAGLALDRARLHEQSAGVAHELQRALLAVDPPVDDRFAVATTYRPGDEMLEVGGDWYDVFLAADGVLALVVGDVVGRGLTAASTMGQLRSAVRAVAGPDVRPADLLVRLDRFVEHVHAAGMATVAYAELDLGDGRLRYACAGHPPPLLLPADGLPRLLWDGRSAPLGAYGRAPARAEGEVQLEPGDRVLLYTDGLFERRERAVDVGLQVLVDTATALRDAPLGDAVETVTERLLRDERVRDDVCVLLASWTGTAFERDLPADLTSLSAVRRALAGWLLERGVEDDARHDVVLAASEAMTNAAEHGSGGSATALVRVRAHVAHPLDGAEEVVVRVHDEGSWREDRPSAERGRGLMIMGSLMDDVVIDESHGTTVVLRRRVHRGQP